MHAIEVQATFCAAHALHLPNGQTETLHGHNFNLTVRLTCQKLDALQTVIDFHEIERLLDEILAPWDNQNLNLMDPFRARINPSAERIAEQIGQRLQSALNTPRRRPRHPPVAFASPKSASPRSPQPPGHLATLKKMHAAFLAAAARGRARLSMRQHFHGKSLGGLLRPPPNHERHPAPDRQKQPPGNLDRNRH